MTPHVAANRIVRRTLRHTRLVALLALGALGATTFACSAQRAPPSSPDSSAQPASPAYGSPAGYPQPGAEPQAAPTTPVAPQQPGMAPMPVVPGGGGSSRSVALANASRDVDSSQRELDVAAGDCRNACRALGSMDRAAGKVCELAQGDNEGRRCDDAKQRVYSARDRVKTTCGSCPGGTSVERSDPIPSSGR
jgi:hypothetical protein